MSEQLELQTIYQARGREPQADAAPTTAQVAVEHTASQTRHQPDVPASRPGTSQLTELPGETFEDIFGDAA